MVLASTSGTLAVSRTERVATEEDLPPIEVVGRWPYYLSKIYEERLVLEFAGKHRLPVVVLNPSLLLGPGDERLSSTWTVMKFLQRDLPAMPAAASASSTCATRPRSSSPRSTAARSAASTSSA